jgi:hypothetical protein
VPDESVTAVAENSMKVDGVEKSPAGAVRPYWSVTRYDNATVQLASRADVGWIITFSVVNGQANLNHQTQLRGNGYCYMDPVAAG